MQTFLPISNFKETAKILDYRRLGKQRVEAMQIINTIEKGSNWRHHPCVKMWQNHVGALKLYHNIIIEEWIFRGYQNKMKLYDISSDVLMPWWFGDFDFHRAHQSNLLRKDFNYYSKFFIDVPSDLPYVWPQQ